MASTEDQTDTTAVVVGTPETDPSGTSAARASARPRRSRAKATAAATVETATADGATETAQATDAPAVDATDAGTTPVKKTARRTRKAAAPAQAPTAAPSGVGDSDGSANDAAAATSDDVAAPAPAPRKRASRRVAAPTGSPEPSVITPAAQTAASTSDRAHADRAHADGAHADGAHADGAHPDGAHADEAAVGASAATSTRTARKRAPRKASAPAAPAPVADAIDPTLDEEAAPSAAEEAAPSAAEALDAEEAAAQTAAVPSFGLLFQAPVVVAPRRRATRPSGTPALPVVAGDGGAQDTLVSADDTADGTETDVDDEALAESDEAGEDTTSTAARRRRRRGGKGRRGRVIDAPAGAESPAPSATPTAGEAGEETEPSQPAVSPDEDSDADSDVRTDLASRRRTRRRRRGSSAGEVEDSPGVVTRVREVRSARDEVVGVRGSTRLEAKKQRRREGREAGRRRQVITEAEFLARRESVERVMVVRAKEGRTQIGVLEDNVLVEHYVSRETNASMAGNIYLGKVQNVLPSMEAAFVDIGRGRNAVLYAGEVNWDAAGMEAGASKRIENALESGQSVLVQVTKDPIGHKGARLTSQVSLPGRYLVYVPDSSMTGISRKLPDTERARLKRILRDVVPETAGVIVRTAAEGASEEELRADVERLTAIWEQIKAKAEAAGSGKKGKGNSPILLHGEPDLTVRVIRDVFNEDFAQMVVSGDEAWAQINDYVGSVAPDLAPRLSKWTGERDVFSQHRIDEQLAKAMDRKVWLPSGGSLVIDRTEAMTVIDVNTGKFVGAGGNLEETVTRNNIEAAEEIVRQLRLRDIGGIIVIDFIDMVLESNRDLVVRRLLECLGRDRTKHQVAEVTSLGLVQMTRKRVGSGLIEVFSQPCDHCNGRGYIIQSEPVERSGSTPSEPDTAPAAGNSTANGNTPRSRSRRGRSGMPSEQSLPQVTTLPSPAPGGPTPAQIAAAAHAAAVKSAGGPESDDVSLGADVEASATSEVPEAAEAADLVGELAAAAHDTDAAHDADAVADDEGAADDSGAVVDVPTLPDATAVGGIDDAGALSDPDSSDDDGSEAGDESAEAGATAEAEAEAEPEPEAEAEAPAATSGGRSAGQGTRRGSRGRRRGRGRASAPAGPPRPGQDG
ncbi:MAG: Ribonuclease G [bacterium ADurb.BinA028]|nr:MAG: Ribonuclease G [bacterium ADurb.BinA028]